MQRYDQSAGQHTFADVNARQNFLLLHFIVFLWGFTGILGKQIEAEAIRLVWLRMIIASIAVLIYVLYKRKKLRITKKALLQFTGVGIIIAAHWVFFYGAIDESNVAVALSCFSVGTLFTAIIEPIFYKRKIRFYEIIFGVIVIASIASIFSVDTRFSNGIILSILAALGSSLFSVFNGMLVKQHDSSVITLYELALGFLMLSGFLGLTGDFNTQFFDFPASDWGYILILSVVCTALPFIISVEIMKHISPYTVTLTVNLEIVYAIAMAYLFWPETEEMNLQFYISAAVLIATVFANAALKKYIK